MKPNLYILKLAIPGLLIFLFTMGACKKEPDKVGLSIRPEDDIVNAFFNDTASITAYSVREDSIRTDETQVSLLGSYLDPVFGKTTASVYTQLRLSENGYEFGTNPVLDSIVLSLDYAGYYGDTNTQLQVRVFQVTETFYKDSVYYSNRNLAYEGVELASQSFYPNPATPVVVGKDTVPAQLRIRLSEDFGNTLLNAPSSVFVDNDGFLEFLKGIVIVPEEVGAGGSICYFNLLSTASNMVIYYSNDEQDSLDFEFLINENCARFINYNHYDYEHAGVDFKAQVLNGQTELGKEKLFLQAMGGIKAKVMFPHIKSFVANGKVAVNEAKFVINDVEPSEDYPSAGRLVVVGINEEGNSYIIPDQFEYYYGGLYDTANNQVIFRITRYIQSLLEEDAQDYGLYILVASSGLLANRQVINGPLPPPPVPFSKRLKLNIIYTPVE